MADLPALLRHFRGAFAADPAGAYADWFRAQEDLREAGPPAAARALADDLYSLLETLTFAEAAERARFVHNLAVFFGSPGPAADLSRARELFSSALAHFDAPDDAGWRARALHNYATAVSNLGETAEELDASIALFREALEWRTPERAIARGVTLHNLGLALRRRAELDPLPRAVSEDLLAHSAGALGEAAAIRKEHGLAEGHARSLFHRGVSLARLFESSRDAGAEREARLCLEAAAEEFDRLGKSDSAGTSRQLLARLSGGDESGGP